MSLSRVTLLVAAALPGALAPLSAQVPTPESVLGFPVGADFELATYERSLEYFQQLAAASDRVELREVGRTSFGRPWYLALISSADNLRNVERHREIAHRLADPPDDMTDEEARRLASEGRVIVHIDGGLHATEVAHGQHTIQLAYDLVTGDNDPEIAAILDNVILLLWFSINPDGQTMVADWYRSNLGTQYEVAPMPRLYQKYIGHDNNRDGYMINQIESRVVTRVVRDWEPQIIYNHHQSSPFPTRIWIPPFAEPISPNVHPLMWRTVNLIGMAMAQALEERGQRGAVHMGSGFDNWYPGFMDHAHNFHNVASFLTETALYRYATPNFYTINDFPADTRDLRPQSLYASPWEGGWWRVGDAVDYMLTASVSVLDVAAKYRTDLLFNRFQAARDVVAQYRAGPPYAYFIPQDQDDPVAAAEMLRRLAFNGIRVHQLQEALTHDGITHVPGSWAILMDQPNANFVRQLFAVQEYPDLREYPEGPPEQPYDVSGWTLPYQFRRAGGGGAYSARRRGAHDPRGARGRAPSLGCRGRRPGVGYSARNRLRQPPGRTCRDASGGQRSWQRRRARTRRGAEQLLPGDGARLARGRECALPARHLLRGRPGRLERALADLRAIGGRAYGTGARPGPAGDLGRPCRRRRAPAPHRPLPPLEREHGRGVDALDSRGVWHRPHEPV